MSAFYRMLALCRIQKPAPSHVGAGFFYSLIGRGDRFSSLFSPICAARRRFRLLILTLVQMMECLLNLPSRLPLALLADYVCGARDAFHKKEEHYYPIARVARHENAHENEDKCNRDYQAREIFETLSCDARGVDAAMWAHK
jgi:hypothetical protein